MLSHTFPEIESCFLKTLPRLHIYTTNLETIPFSLHATMNEYFQNIQHFILTKNLLVFTFTPISLGPLFFMFYHYTYMTLTEYTCDLLIDASSAIENIIAASCCVFCCVTKLFPEQIAEREKQKRKTKIGKGRII